MHPSFLGADLYLLKI